MSTNMCKLPLVLFLWEILLEQTLLWQTEHWYIKAIKRNLPLCGPNYSSWGWTLAFVNGFFSLYFFIHLLAFVGSFFVVSCSLPTYILPPIPLFLSYMSPPIHHLTTAISSFSSHVFFFLFIDIYIYFGQVGGASGSRVCYQRGLPRLVYKIQNFLAASWASIITTYFIKLLSTGNLYVNVF